MDRNFLQNLSNLTGLPMDQLLDKLGRIDVIDNPFAKADPERVRPEGAPAGNDPQLQVGNGLSAGAANGGPLPSTTANPAAAAAASPRGGGGTQAYQLGGVKEGFWGGVNQLASANNISNPNQLSVGQQIKMPDGSSYTVRGGDTLSGIYQSRSAAATPAAPAAPAAAAPAAQPTAIGRTSANANNGPGVAQNRRDPNAPAVTASPSRTGTTGASGEPIQPNLNRAPPDLTSAPTDPMTNGERLQGNQPPAAGPRPGGSVYPAGTDERTGGGAIQPPTAASAPAPSSTSRVGPNANVRGNTNVGGGGIQPPAAASTRAPSTPGINGPTFREAGQRLYDHFFGAPNPSKYAGTPMAPAPSGRGAQPNAVRSRYAATPMAPASAQPLTRSLKKKGAWFSSATHPVIRGY